MSKMPRIRAVCVMAFIEKAKGKRILKKFPKICKHINKRKQLMETKQTKC